MSFEQPGETLSHHEQLQRGITEAITDFDRLE